MRINGNTPSTERENRKWKQKMEIKEKVLLKPSAFKGSD